MADKPKVAIYWLGGCGGCDEAIVDLNEHLLEVAERIEIVLWPLAMDFKYSSIEAMKEREIAVSIISGSVRNSEHREMAKLLRSKSQLVVAFGAWFLVAGFCIPASSIALASTLRRCRHDRLYRYPGQLQDISFMLTR